MKKLLLCAFALVLLSGCVSTRTVPLTPATATAMKGETIAQTKRPLPDFTAMTAGKAGFGLLGAGLMISEGNAIIADNKVQDPADAIAASLVADLNRAHGVKASGQPVAVDSGDTATIAAAARGSARFILDVQTTGWTFTYFPTDWTHYRVIYSAKARLVDASTKALVAEGFCNRTPESNVGAPTYDELVSNQAAGLKKHLAQAAEECTKVFKSQMLMM